MRRSNMFQPYCTTSTRRTAMHASISSSLKFERPTKRTLPSRTTSSSALHRLLERRHPVGPVHEVDVDVVGAEVLQALVDRRDDALAAAVAQVRLVAVVHAELGDDDRLVATLAERLAERAFGGAHAVALGGVEAVDAEVERAADGAHELRLLDVAVAAADLPAAVADGRDLEAGPSERSMLHCRSPRGRVQSHVN